MLGGTKWQAHNVSQLCRDLPPAPHDCMNTHSQNVFHSIYTFLSICSLTPKLFHLSRSVQTLVDTEENVNKDLTAYVNTRFVLVILIMWSVLQSRCHIIAKPKSVSTSSKGLHAELFQPSLAIYTTSISIQLQQAYLTLITREIDLKQTKKIYLYYYHYNWD